MPGKNSIIFVLTALLVLLAAPARAAVPDTSSSTDHGGANVTISSLTTWSGTHFNIGTLTITSTLEPSAGAPLRIYANNVDITATGYINASGRGYAGGAGGSGPSQSGSPGGGPGGGAGGHVWSGQGMSGGGGGHGGTGGEGSSDGSTRPAGGGPNGHDRFYLVGEMGSGGGGGGRPSAALHPLCTGNSFGNGGPGGGYVLIVASGTVNVDGTINAEPVGELESDRLSQRVLPPHSPVLVRPPAAGRNGSKSPAPRRLTRRSHEPT